MNKFYTMLCLSDFVQGRKRFYNRKIYLLLSNLSDFMTCSEPFNIQSKGSISQLEHWRMIKFSTYMFTRHLYTQIVNNVTPE